MFKKFCFMLTGVLVMFSNAIYASGDAEIMPMKQHIPDEGLCSAAIREAGIEYDVKHDLLQTISAVESGQWDYQQNKYVAWPWTVNAGGKGYYYSSREEAVDAVKKFQKQGYKSIDVGCMQINLKYHGEAFNSVEEALDPYKNVRYSAKFLRSLYDRLGKSWEKASKRYHSANPQKAEAYVKRLQKRFAKIKLADAKVTNLF